MKKTIVIRGGGDIASGIAHRLKSSGFDVIILEVLKPTVIRRTVAFANAVFEGKMTVENITARLAGSLDEIKQIISSGQIPVVIDPEGETISRLKPRILVDSILAKKNTGTTKNMAPIVIAVGPGFTAGVDVHAVVESKRGHYLGSVIYSGRAFADTGIPGEIKGYSEQRIIRACDSGIMLNQRHIGELVLAGDVIGTINGNDVTAQINGVLRGLIQNGSDVYKGMKIGDVDPRGEVDYCSSISDKARAIAGGVLEAALSLESKMR